jgi:hypothetical protein
MMMFYYASTHASIHELSNDLFYSLLNCEYSVDWW